MDIYVINKKEGLQCLYPSDFEEKKKLKLDQVYKVSITKPRNYQFHKKFFALVKIGCENSKNVDMPFNAYRNYITIKSGYADIYQTPKGTYVQAKSISFSNMDEDEFTEVFNKVLDKIIIDIQADKEMIERELLNFM